MIQINRSGVTFRGAPGDLQNLRSQFDQRHCVLLRDFFEPELLALVRRRLESAGFQDHHDSGIAEELMAQDKTLNGLLHIVTNNPKLFELVKEITGCDPIGSFGGRVYRMIPGGGHYDTWHSDVGDNRLITLSLNLSADVYSGGLLQIREVESGRIVHEVANTGLGDAILFRISTKLCHRVSALEGTGAKTAFAGWFKSQPSYQRIFADLRGETEDNANHALPQE
jgi:hypothetical protein